MFCRILPQIEKTRYSPTSGGMLAVQRVIIPDKDVTEPQSGHSHSKKYPNNTVGVIGAVLPAPSMPNSFLK